VDSTQVKCNIMGDTKFGRNIDCHGYTNCVNLNVFGCDLSFLLHHKQKSGVVKIPKVN